MYVFVPNLLVYIKRGIKRKIQVNFLNLKEIPEFLVVSPGGCGSVNLIRYLENFGKSNLYFERKYKIFGLGHIYKPNNFLFSNGAFSTSTFFISQFSNKFCIYLIGSILLIGQFSVTTP